ncbi:4-hydroxy-tetrahydrodipicolinate synthase [Arthrobacter pigmenti]|uniref:4-hydroxy-tetrahydrodipicolinate synthase n=1 Tax=Arthrobacter pigmenti TaxID=271432 RepID=A0A846RNX7_9MICC|nr:dihydrodipicolinate synthase family protein [Arthrobacter pigmenti]NJC22312.1 4-hydroxy-tetrahydrodipicolinate synthase [Arthrobacter pigmenti]
MVFTGVVAYPVTPFDADGAVSFPELKLLIGGLADSGVDTVTVLGSSGSFAYLDAAERERVLAEAVEAAAGRIPVAAGISAVATREVVVGAKAAQRNGAAGLVLSPVSYLPLTDDEVAALVEEVAAVTNLPICLYNNPTTTQFSFGLELVARLAAIETVTGFKDTAASPDGFADRVRMLRDLVDAPLSHGASGDTLIVTGEVSGDAWHTGLAALLPVSYRNFRLAVVSGDDARIALERSRLLPVVNAVQRLRKLSGLHALAKACGIDAGDPRPPLLPIAGSDQRELARLADAFDDQEESVS